jgi:adenosylcobinamide-GDP ribazoletransferase
MTGLILAFQFLTRLPMPCIAATEADFARSMRWFPLVGLAIGALLAVAAWFGGHVDPWTGALAALAVWVAVTGALHLDGFADIADAAGAAHKNRERLLAVLADPHVGSFGVVAIALQLIAKLVLLHGLIAGGAFAALALVPFAARIGPLAWARALPPLHDGLGARFRNAVAPVHLAAWGVVLIAAAWLAPAVLVAPLLIGGWAVWLQHRLGGISGDGHGAGIELVETGLLAALLVAGRFG